MIQVVKKIPNPLMTCVNHFFIKELYFIYTILHYEMQHNTGAGMMEVNPSLFGNHMTGNVDLYIK